MKLTQKRTYNFALGSLIGLSILAAGCGAEDPSAALAALSAGQKVYAKSLLSCNPLSGGSGQAIDYNLGLAARLYYTPAGQTNTSNRVSDYINNGADLGVDIFFNQVNVQPTYFTQGFPSEAGPAFRTPNGNILMEWFGIRYRSTLRLANKAPGRYQIATLSDDGSVLYIAPNGVNGNSVKLVDNDGQHATRMACSSDVITMDANTRIPIQLDYFQGPRYRLTSMMLWRHIPDNVDLNANPSALNDPACGVAGIDTFFVTNTNGTPSTPTQYYQNILSRGWEVIPEENFVLPNTDPANPCFPGGGVVIGI
ncbi:hypothetical protein K2X30_03370 [bacterium]|jgi:hypothetical protein|nr:hypothetical protein [bacterium]